ncbi:MAG: RNase adapter RapZ [Bdellovibrionales bacterium]|nr:RNase adapter RapZ [Bdellovibrionales bacterium]
MQLVIISGHSGAGKSAAIKAFEDLGYYCVDNLPVLLLDDCIEIIARSKRRATKLALVIDARDKSHLSLLPKLLDKYRNNKNSVTVLFLESSDAVLARRYSETRRRHPLAVKGSLLSGIKKEKQILSDIRNLSDSVINTSEMTAGDLRRHIMHVYDTDLAKRRMVVLLTSFGFKYGIPLNADMVFDVRFIKNPFFEKHLKSKTGNHRKVSTFVLGQKGVSIFLDHVEKLLRCVLPNFENETRSYLNLCIGCTGGKHRSVAIVNEIFQRLPKDRFNIVTHHRDIEME